MATPAADIDAVDPAADEELAEFETQFGGSVHSTIARVGRRWWAVVWVWLLPLPFLTLYCLLSLTRFARLDTPSWDNAIFEQAVAGYAHLQAPIVDVKAPGLNQLADHFSPILVLLAPVYRLWPDARTLLVAQAVLVAVSIVPITRAARRLLGTGAAVAIGAAYGLSFGIQSAIEVDFHEVAFAAPLLAFAGEAGLRRDWKAAYWWCLPLLLVKEDLGLTVAAIGAVAWLGGHRRAGRWLAVTGVTGTAVSVLVLIPVLGHHGGFSYWGLFGLNGDGPGLGPTLATGWNVKAMTLVLTFGITGFLALRSPWALVTVPTLLWRFGGDRDSFWGTDWHYSLVLMPVLFIATLDAIARVGGPPWLRRYAGHVPTVMLFVALVLSLQFPFKGLLEASTYRGSDRSAAAAEVIARMPRGASVETNLGLITHLTTHYRVYWIDTIGPVVPDYVLLDTRTDDVVALAERHHPGTRYRQIFGRDGYLLAQRVDSPQQSE